METKLFSLILLTAIVLVGLVSAATDLTASLDKDFTKADDTVVLTIKNPTGSDITGVNINSIPDITDGTNSLVIARDPTGTFTVLANDEETFNLSFSGDASDLILGTHSTIVTIVDGTDTLDVDLDFINTFCSNGIREDFNDGSAIFELAMEIDDLDSTGFGAEDEEWYPLDEIEIDVKVDNDGNEDVDDVTIEFCLYDEDNDDCVLDEDDVDITNEEFNLKDGKDEDILISFRLDPDEVDESGKYIVYVKAYSDDKDIGEENLCSEEFIEIDVIEDDFVILNDVQLPDTVSCGETIDVSADVWNIGDDEEEDVAVRIQNKELGIDKTIEAGDVDNWDKQDITFTLNVPEGADEKSYNLKFTVYDEDGDVFESEEDDEAIFNFALKVEGNCIKPVTSDASISATLETEDVQAGQEVTIKATIRNTGEEETDYSIGVEGYEFFSTVQSINPSTVTLQPGKSQDVLITLKLNNDAAGEQVFNIKALFGNDEVRQGVSLTVPDGGVSLTGGAIGATIRENWFIWVIVLINIILIIAIIIVAARMSRA